MADPANVIPVVDGTAKAAPASPPAGGLASADVMNPDVVDMPAEQGAGDGAHQLFANEIMVLMTLFAASTITMIAAARECDKPTPVACSSISAFLTAVHIFTHRFQPELHTKMAPGLGAFLVIWWICGVGAGTFKAPFKSFGNGYISEWICFFASLYYCSMAVPKCGQMFAAAEEKVSTRRTTQYAGLLVLLGFIILLAVLVECNESSNSCDAEYGYAIVASIVSMIFNGAYIPLHNRCSETIQKYFGFFMLVWWGAAAGTFTFDKPFKGGSTSAVGNGWFASWGSFILALVFTLEAWGYGSEQVAAPSDTTAADLEAPAADPEGPRPMESAEA